MSDLDPAVLRRLISLVETGAGPDRALDAVIEDTIGEASEKPGQHLLAGRFGGRQKWLETISPNYTTSLDATFKLFERVLPGWDVHFYRDDDRGDKYVAELVWPKGAITGERGYFGADGCAPGRARAVLAGLLEGLHLLTVDRRALDQVKGEGGGDAG